MTTDKRHINIIIADDHPIVIEGIRSLLRENDGYHIIAAFHDIQSMLNAKGEYAPDIIILDINMPHINGFDGCKPLKQLYPQCKILAHTVYTQFSDKLKQLGFDGYVVKNCEPEILIQAVNAVMNNSKYFYASPDPGTAGKDFDKFDKVKDLTRTETEIMKLVAQGLSNQEIAAKKYVSVFTVKTHRRNIYEKIGVGNTAELISFMIKNGISFRDNLAMKDDPEAV